MPPRQVLEGIRFVLGTGCGWRGAPERFGSGATLHRYYQDWSRRGLLARLAEEGLLRHDRS